MDLNDMAILRMPKVSELVGLCPRQIRRDVKSGAFPAPVQLTARAVGWRRGDVAGWLASRGTVARAP